MIETWLAAMLKYTAAGGTEKATAMFFLQVRNRIACQHVDVPLANMAR
ncbi:hypothetical protein [Paracoccus fontiphilus]|nr:hypothetical protein [Paracoccus fontiphilus]